MFSRSTAFHVMLAGITCVLLVVAISRYLLLDGSLADPVSVHISGTYDDTLDDDARSDRVWYGPEQKGVFYRMPNTSYWNARDTWVSDVVIIMPSSQVRLATVTIHLGSERATISGADLAREHKVDPDVWGLRGPVLLPLPNVFGRTSSLPWVGESAPWNWPGDVRYLRAVAQYSLVPVLAVLLLLFLAIRSRSDEGRDWCQRVLGLVDEATTQQPAGRTWNLVGLAFLTGALTFLEVREPYYFTQDDNLVDCLPAILWGCRCFWQGEFPDYNPFLFLGSPLANLGMYSLTYPPLHLSYGVARHLLGDENATIEVFTILHIVAGFFITRHLGRRLGMGALSANVTALSFVLSGAILIVGRSWFNFVPLVFWLPTMFLGIVRLTEGPVSWRWIVGMGLASGLSFHVGFSQAAVYLCGFFCLGVVYVALIGSVPWKRAVLALPALVIGAGLALPLVYQQWLLSRGIERFEPNSQGIGRGLAAMLLPYPLVEAELPTAWANVHSEAMGHFYFFGGVLGLLFLLQVVGLVYYRPERKHWAGQMWTVLGLVAVWLALGESGGLWEVVSRLPVVGFINRYPMRLMPFVVFFACVAGGLVLGRVLGDGRLRLPAKRVECLVALVIAGLLGWHVVQCRTAFYVYGFRPYPELPTEMAELFRKDGQNTARMASWGRLRSSNANYGLLFPHNVAAAYELPSLAGYNPILEGRTNLQAVKADLESQTLAALRAYGVRWHLAHSPDRVPTVRTLRFGSWFLEVLPQNAGALRNLRLDTLPVVYEHDGMRIAKLSEVAPLAFPEGSSQRSLPVTYHGWGVEVDVAGLTAGQRVVVNFLHYPEMAATLDDEPIPCEADRWNRVVAELPATGSSLRIRYAPRWTAGLWPGIALVVVGIGLSVIGSRRR